MVPGAAVTSRKILRLKTSNILWCQAEPALTPGCVEGWSRQEIRARCQISGKSLGEAILGRVYLVTAKGFPNLTQQSTKW